MTIVWKYIYSQPVIDRLREPQLQVPLKFSYLVTSWIIHLTGKITKVYPATVPLLSPMSL